MNTRQEKVMDMKKMQTSHRIFFFFLRKPLCVGEVFKKENCVYSFSPNEEVNDRSTGNESESERPEKKIPHCQYVQTLGKVTI